MKAILVIDMQVGSFKPETPRFDADVVVQKINLLSNYFRQNGDKVIFIQHDGTKDNSFLPGTPDWNILPALIRRPDDLVLGKTANDPFYNTDLENVLNKCKIKELFITGCATDFCVDAAVHSALNKDYNVVIVKDCHTTTNRPHLSAEKVIQHHNWVWENMIPTNGKIKLVSSKDLLKKQNVI
jgi:nicotinamidase-related amidase